MIKGIIFFEQGEVQVVGEINSFQGIINTMQKVLPELIKAEKERVVNDLDEEQLEKLLAEKRAKKEQKDLEP